MEGNQFVCPVKGCSKDLGRLNTHNRTKHVNSCKDKEKAKKRSKKPVKWIGSFFPKIPKLAADDSVTSDIPADFSLSFQEKGDRDMIGMGHDVH